MSDEFIVRDFMTAPVTRLSPRASLLDAGLTLRRTGFRHLPIVDGDRLVGILTERDIHRAAPSLLSRITEEEYNAVFANGQIERVITRKSLPVTPGTPLGKAAAIRRVKKIACLPVVQDGRLVGIITVNDMLRALRHLLAGPGSQKSPVGDR